MGKKAQKWGNQAPWRAEDSSGGQQDGQSYWSYWPGSWRANNTQKPPKGGPDDPKKSSLKLLDYNQIQLSNGGGQNRAPENAMDVSDMEEQDCQSYVKLLQRLLNNARRAEARSRKLITEKERKCAQWEEFQATLRAKFLEQRGLFQKETKQIDRELAELVDQRHSCLQQIQAAVASGGRSGGETLQNGPVPTSEDLAAWDSFMDLSPETPTSKEDEIIRKALQAAQHPEAFMAGGLDAMATGASEKSADAAVSLAIGMPVGTPQRRSQRAMPLTPQPKQGAGKSSNQDIANARIALLQTSVETQYAGSQPAVSDPYIASPLPTTAAAGPNTPRTPVKTAMRPFRQRVSVKDGARPTAVARASMGDKITLGDKLQAKRLQELARQGTSHPSASMPAGTQLFNLLDDDDEVLETTRPPDLSTME